jgi:hypothetical protein
LGFSGSNNITLLLTGPQAPSMGWSPFCHSHCLQAAQPSPDFFLGTSARLWMFLSFPLSTMTYRAGFFFVEKKDKTLHPCIDYCRLNHITVKKSLPLTTPLLGF